jgi:hypothetical protein
MRLRLEDAARLMILEARRLLTWRRSRSDAFQIGERADLRRRLDFVA